MKFYLRKARLLKTIQDGLWKEFTTLMAECDILSFQIQKLKESLSPRELSAFMNFKETKEIAQKEQETVSQIHYCQRIGRRRFWQSFSVERTNYKLRIHINLKQKHNTLLKEALSILLDFVNGKKTA